MRSFLKIFFASLLALVVFTVLGGLVIVYIAGKVTAPEKPNIGSNAVLVLDLSTNFHEQSEENPLSSVLSNTEPSPGLNDMIRIIRYAATDTAVKGLYIKAGYNNNGFAASEELRQAIVSFKQHKKFVIAYGEMMTQKAYYVATAADKIYLHPQGNLEWQGLSTTVYFVKELLDKLQIDPQVFYAGKFKSATEPLRVTHMTDANRLQTAVLLGDLYSELLTKTADARKLDTAGLHALANAGTIQTANDALQQHLVDGLKYDDQVKTELFGLMHIKETEKINFVFAGKYAREVENKEKSDRKNKIALIYAQGEIADGKGQDGEIGSDNFRNLIRQARFDKDIKAIVFRVNSPGGSALASDVIWRELELARKEKPVVVSMGDMAASGGYYIACNGDSIYADPGTITGSIGVFTIVPNLQGFFKNKIGISFDNVQTGPYASMGDVNRPLTETEKRFMQASIDSIYSSFKSRVASSRKKTMAYIDSIAQGRVWAGQRAVEIGLVDRIGTLQDAIACAVRMSKTTDYSIQEFPEKKSVLELLINGSVNRSVKARMMKEELGEQEFGLLKQLKQVRSWLGVPQSRLPFELDIH